jgi:hypothetical protein
MKMRLLILLAVMLHAMSIIPVHAAPNELRTITLKHRFADDLLPVVQPLVGPGGTASGMNNVLIIRTTPERMAEIERLVSELDVMRRNLRIEVSHDSSLQSTDSRISASGRGRVGDTEIVIGEPGRRQQGARVQIGQGSSRMSRQGTQFLTVMDGGDAFIEVGQSVPYTQQWAMFTQQYAKVQQTIEFEDITTGFAVSPRYIGDEVELEITPRITRLGRGRAIDFEALSTRVRVRPGEWFNLGGTMASSDEVSRAILQTGSGSTAESSSLMIRVSE